MENENLQAAGGSLGNRVKQLAWARVKVRFRVRVRVFMLRFLDGINSRVIMW